MKTFRITFQELCEHQFFVEAETQEEVEARFEEDMCNGTFDWSNGEVIYNKIVDYEEVN